MKLLLWSLLFPLAFTPPAVSHPFSLYHITQIVQKEINCVLLLKISNTEFISTELIQQFITWHNSFAK